MFINYIHNICIINIVDYTSGRTNKVINITILDTDDTGMCAYRY